MSPAAGFHAQLASIMEVLANTAVAEICELVDSGYSMLQLEISRSRKENEVLRRKLRLVELRNARANAMRNTATASSTALQLANGRARALLPAHHPGNEPRRNGASGGDLVLCRASSQETIQCGNTDPSSESGQVTTQRTMSEGETNPLQPSVIKVEDDDETWDKSGHGNDHGDLCVVVVGQMADTNAPLQQNKQEVTEESSSSARAWSSEEVSSTSVSIQNLTNTGQSSETSDYDCVILEPELQHGSMTTQDSLQEDPSCSYMMNTGERAVSDSGSSFTFSVSELSPSIVEQRQPPGLHNNHQRSLQPPLRRDTRERFSAFMRRDRWRSQDGVNRVSGHSRDDSGGGRFMCNFCGKKLACLKNLKTHMRVHTGEKPFVCALCGKCFSDSSNLKRHQSVHTGEKRYGCVHCGKRFAQSGSLKVHMSVHTDCKQFRCMQCGKTFISSSHLRRHVASHAREKQITQTLQ